jgi:hypothetical protein
MTGGDLFRAWLRPVAALAGLIGSSAALVHHEWLAFGIYFAVFLAFTALSVLTVRDVRAAKAKSQAASEPGAQPAERAGS